MSTLLRRLRGALGIGVTWAVSWAGIGLILGVILRVLRPQDFDEGESIGKAVMIFGVIGFLSGLGFSLLLSLGERRGSVNELSLWRVAIWGLLGGVGIPLLMGTDGSMAVMTGPLGALFATASVAAARRKAIRGSDQPQLHE